MDDKQKLALGSLSNENDLMKPRIKSSLPKTFEMYQENVLYFNKKIIIIIG